MNSVADREPQQLSMLSKVQECSPEPEGSLVLLVKDPVSGQAVVKSLLGALRNLPALSSGLDLVSLWFPFGFTLICRPLRGREMRVKPKGNQSETKSRPLDKAGRLRRAPREALNRSPDPLQGSLSLIAWK